MPVLRISRDPGRTSEPVDGQRLCESIVAALKSVIGAEEEMISILLDRVEIPAGPPIYVEIRARDAESRPAEVIERLLQALGAELESAFGAPCRIRYYPIAGHRLFARG